MRINFIDWLVVKTTFIDQLVVKDTLIDKLVAKLYCLVGCED